MRYLPIHAINFVYSSAREIQCWGRYVCLLTKAKRGITLRLRGLQCSFLFSGFGFMKWGAHFPLWMKMSFHSPSTVLKFRICFPKNASKIDAPLESQIEILTHSSFFILIERSRSQLITAQTFEYDWFFSW